MHLTKRGNAYFPSYPADHTESQKVKEGEEVQAKRARNPGHHRKFFALLNLGFSSQDKIDNFEIYRMVTLMKAGHVVFVKGTDGKDHPLPKSISWDKMGQEEFERVYSAVLTVICKEVGLTSEEIQNELISFM